LAELLTIYSTGPGSLAQLLGFKFSSFHATASDTPDALYGTASILIKKGAVTLEQLWPHLTPTDEHIKTEMEERFKDARKYRVPREEEEAEADEIKMEKALMDSGASNQKLGLCFACLCRDAFEAAFDIMSLFPRYYAASYLPIKRRLIRTLHATIETVYRADGPWCGRPVKNDTSASLPGVSSIADVAGVLVPWLREMGVLVSQDTLVITKLLRVFQRLIADKSTAQVRNAHWNFCLLFLHSHFFFFYFFLYFFCLIALVAHTDTSILPPFRLAFVFATLSTSLPT